MWSYEILGTDIYHLLAAFVLYSVLGWALESAYMSLCNRKLTNGDSARDRSVRSMVLAECWDI